MRDGWRSFSSHCVPLAAASQGILGPQMPAQPRASSVPAAASPRSHATSHDPFAAVAPYLLPLMLRVTADGQPARHCAADGA